jgi:hypothetical protein
LQFRSSSLLLAGVSVLAAGLASCGDHDDVPAGELACQLKPTETFHERIEPLLSTDRPTTCNQCHLSGVDLSAFARETPCKTWACLVDQGLVDVQAPESSKILAWIERASPDSDLITPQVIEAEHDAFRDWIDANAACPSACEGVKCGSIADGPSCPTPKRDPLDLTAGEDTRGCSDVDLEQAFYDDVYTWRSRCASCHSDTQLKADKNAPRWISEVGNCQTGSAVTLKRVLSLGLIDLEQPDQSLILLKPLTERNGGVKHGGDEKFADMTDLAYQSFLRFIVHYKDCTQPHAVDP